MTQLSTLHTAQGIGATQRMSVPAGMSIEEIALASHSVVDGLTAWVRAPEGYLTEWLEVPRHMWRYIKPKVDDALLFGFRMGQNALRDVFAIAATVLVSIAAPFLAPILGTVGAALATAALGVGASLAINALFPASQANASLSGAITSRPQEKARQFANVSSDSNVLARESYLPIVVGTRRISPPEIATPLLFLENGIQSINRIFALDGHHSLSDVQVDRVPVSDFASITTEIKDGAETTPVTTFIDKISNLYVVGDTLSAFSLDGVDLVDQETPANSEPRWVRFPTIYDKKLEEITIRLQIASLIKSDSATQSVRIPIRVRFRPKGSSGAWENLPEIHIVGRDVSTSLKEIRVRWDNEFGVADTSGDIQYEFFQKVPAADYTLSDGSTGVQWQADSHFVLGAGSALRDTQNISGKRNGVRVVLDESVHPKQEYEWEVIRGICTNSDSLSTSTYELGGAVNSLFVARNTNSKWQVPLDQGAYIGRVTVSQATSIVNKDPCQRPKTALLALNSTGQSVKNITVLAKRYVNDWDGSGWNTLTTTDNPAVHYRQVLFDYLSYHGFNTDVISNQQFVDWRTECATQGYKVSGVFAGASVKEVLDSIATAGFARPRISDGFGIDWFRDRSSERPKQTFSPRNSEVSIQWVSTEKPIGIRAKFQNEDDDFADDEVQINNPFYANFVGYDLRTYDSIASPSLVERRAYFDLLQSFHQGRRAWIVNTSTEGLICERGDLVGVVTDLMDDTNHGARIRKVIDTTTFTIDQDISAESTTEIFSSPGIFDETDIFEVGAQSVCLVSTPTGTEMVTVVAAETTDDGYTIRVSPALSSTDIKGAHIAIGPASRFMKRCIVSTVDRLNEERAQLVLVDEAPEIFEQMQEKFG